MSWAVHYYQSQSGNSPIEEFLDGLPLKARAKCVAYIKLLEGRGFELPGSFIKKVRGRIWELRPEWAGTEYRFFYVAMVGEQLVILHAIQKQSQKLKERDIKLAEDRYADLIRRFGDEDTPPVHQRAD